MNIEFKNDSDMNICLQREDTDKYIYIKSVEDGIRIEYTNKEDDKPNNQTDYKHKEKMETNKIKPKELLKDGMFVLNDGVWHVVVGKYFISENGGYSFISEYDDDLCWFYNNDFQYNAIVDAWSFDSAKRKYEEGNVIWKRK